LNSEQRLERIAGLKAAPRSQPENHGQRAGPALPLDRVKRSTYPLHHGHGGFQLGVALKGDMTAVNPLAHDLGIQDVDVRNLAFLDTETTGLGGGAGCLVFLVGLGHFTHDAFVVEQHLLTSPGEEEGFLEGIRASLEGFPGVATYFGKAFDRPRLEDRFVFHHKDFKLPADPHLDLHTLARRLWGEHLPDCKLRTLEERILGFERTDDLPGALCPEAYRCHLNGDSSLLQGVLDHNLDDILSLAVLIHVVRLEALHPASIKARILVARGLEALGRPDRALALLESAAAEERSQNDEFGGRYATRHRALRALAEALKRWGQLEKAVVQWGAMVEAGEGGIYPLVELAKHFEHHEGDPARALTLTRAARKICSRHEKPTLEHRLERLIRKGGASKASGTLEPGPGTLASRLPLSRPAGSGRGRHDLDAVADEA